MSLNRYVKKFLNHKSVEETRKKFQGEVVQDQKENDPLVFCVWKPLNIDGNWLRETQLEN